MQGARGRTAVRLRRWLLAGSIVFVAALAGVFGYAKFRAHRFITGLPQRLDADIRSETNGFTYSQSVKGRTLFTVHASKAIQRQNGKTTLHDVDITLNGRPGSPGTDRIRGAEFEYDQPNGVIRATGEVHLDLLSPGESVADGKPGHEGQKRIEVITDGLVFVEKLGVAATDGPVHFAYGAAAGDARGADYDADSGTLRLRHDVHVLSEADGHRSVLTASAAELERTSRKATLRDAQLTSDGRNLHAATMFLSMRSDGSLENVQAEGDVQLATTTGEHVFSPRLIAAVGQANRIQQIHMVDGVRFLGPGKSATAVEATLICNSAGEPAHMTLLRQVRLLADGRQPGQQRELTADRVDADLLSGEKGHVLARDVTATGSAKLVALVPAQAGERPGRTVLTANMLHAHLSSHGEQWSVEQIEGRGSTGLEQDDGRGLQRSSTGDSLLILLRQDQHARGEDALLRTVQRGNVMLREKRAAALSAKGLPANVATESRAKGQVAEFDGATQELTLTGSPEVASPGIQLAADRIRVSRATGDAVAEGTVRGSYWKSATSTAAEGGTVHVLASRAELSQGNDHLVFSGGPRPVRLWSSASQLEAPIVELNRMAGKLFAHGTTALPGSVVHAVLPSEGTARRDGNAPVKGGIGASSKTPVRIQSRELVWTQGTDDHPGQAVFTGAVRVDQPGGTLTADTATAYLRGTGVREPGAAALETKAPLSGSLESVVATGDVVLQQPGRKGTGGQLRYTATDGRFELTGSPTREPEVVDALRGSITGQTLIFHAGDDSVEVAGSPGSRVRSETHVKSSASRSN